LSGSLRPGFNVPAMGTALEICFFGYEEQKRKHVKSRFQLSGLDALVSLNQMLVQMSGILRGLQFEKAITTY
jgi:hypothetical protein